MIRSIDDYLAQYQPGIFIMLWSLVPIKQLYMPQGLEGAQWTMAVQVIEADARGILYRSPTDQVFFQPWPVYPFYFRIVPNPYTKRGEAQ